LTTSAAKSLAKRAGYGSVEDFKRKYATGSPAHWDLFKDKSTGYIWLGNKSQTVFTNTGIK